MESEKKHSKPVNPRVRANILSKMFFIYMLPVFRKNYKNELKESDLNAILDEHEATGLGDRFESVWKTQHRKHKRWAMHRTCFKIHGVEFAILGLLQFIDEMMLLLATPMGVGGLVSYFENPLEVSLEEAYMYAGLIILALLVDLFINNHASIAMDHMSMKLRLSCSSLVYRKALRLSRGALATTTVGQITNLLSNDVGKFDFGFYVINYVWIAPISTCIGTYLLYRIVGVSAFAGISFLLLFIPLQIYFGNRTATLRLRTALRTDERVRLMNEILNAIQVIKMYTWEKPFAKLISLARRYEIKAIRQNFFLEAITFTLEMILTKIAFVITIIVYLALGNDMSANTIYSTIAIYDVLRPGITLMFSYGISSASEIHVTLNRVQTFLSNEELARVEEPPKDDLKNGVVFEGVSAKWLADSPENCLSVINLRIDHPQLVAVIGQVGSGKSTLFNVILKELLPSEGKIFVHGKVSYAAQESWLFSASVRQNVLFGEPYEEQKYKKVLKMCALEQDISGFPHGDKTIVGEKGKVLSGGQKARINLARCVYRHADIYLLDDPLSAVDTKVGKQLYEECITNFLSDKICILITHQLQYLKHAHKIIIMEDGKIAGMGTYDELQTTGLDFAVLLKKFTDGEGDPNKNVLSRQNTIVDEEEEEDVDPEEETLQTGKISPRTYLDYLKAGGHPFIIVLLVCAFIATHGANSGGDFYISNWVNMEQKALEQGENITTIEEVDRTTMLYYYLGIIGALTVLATVQSVFFTIFFMRASINMHDSIFAKVIAATMRFFNVNPTGRILNRFSKDLGVIDEALPYIFYDVIQVLLTFCSVVVLTSIINPWLLLPAFVVLVVFYFLRNIYLATSRSVKRIEGITRSPIFTHMTASMHGLTTIRAFKAQETLIKEFDSHQDHHSSAWFLYFSSNISFAFYLQFICSIIVSIVTLNFLLFPKDYYGGEAGLILTQYLSITSILEWGMRNWSALENNMTSAERAIEYKKVETEPERKPLSTLPRNWPELGRIKSENLCMRYNPTEDFVLKYLNFTIEPCEKIGVVGRTGAGKSSIIAALFQLYKTEGSIAIDDINTKEVPLNDLRSKISIIPQDPVLFSGTVRRNLDPFEEFQDEILWNALEQVELKSVISELPQGLYGTVDENGSNFSVGQRQLVCLARAIIRNNRILVMDEATANVDPYTDTLIQKAIREKFAKCTVITIAHRLHTVMDSDKVLVVDAGTIAEFGHPHELLQNTDGIFYKMVQTTGDAASKSLKNIAEENYRKCNR